MQKGREELRVFIGLPGPDLFARRPQKVAVAMPNEKSDEQENHDLDGTGRPQAHPMDRNCQSPRGRGGGEPEHSETVGGPTL